MKTNDQHRRTSLEPGSRSSKRSPELRIVTPGFEEQIGWRNVINHRRSHPTDTHGMLSNSCAHGLFPVVEGEGVIASFPQKLTFDFKANFSPISEGIDVTDCNGCDIFPVLKFPFGIIKRSKHHFVATPSHSISLLLVSSIGLSWIIQTSVWRNTFDWQTATYGKVEYCENEDDSFTNFETKYPTIVFDDTSDATLSCEPMVSPLNNNEIDFKISFDESDDEDYMVIFNKKSFSYKIIYVYNLKTDSENENDKVNMPSSPSPEPTIGYIDDFDFIKDFENEFPTIVYNDDLKSKLDPLIEPCVSSRDIDKFDSKNETSLAEYDEEEQNVLYFNDSFPLDVHLYAVSIYCPIRRIGQFPIRRIELDTEPLPSRGQRHPWLRYQVEGYGEDIVHSYEQRLETIWGRLVNRVHVLDFSGLTEGMRQTLGDWLRMVYTGDKGHELFTSHAWRRMSDMEMGLDVANTLCFQLGGARRRMTWRQFILALELHTEEEMTEAGLEPISRVVREHAEGRKSGARLSGGYFIGCLVAYFGLVSDQGLRGLLVGTRELPLIDLNELRRLNICLKIGDTWAWVAPRLERQPDAVAGAPGVVEDALVIDEGAQADPAPVQVPQPPPPVPRSIQQRISRLKEEVMKLRWSILMDASGRTYQAFDNTLVGNSHLPYQRRTRRRTDDASTLAPQQPDP
ncbi:hypothetical protein Tco_1468023 [Tanacetum coccineum]